VLQYGLPDDALKRQIAELMARRGVSCTEDQVFLTTGSQQAMDLASRLLVDPGDCVLLEQSIYDGIRMAVKARQPRVLPVATDPDEGIDLEDLEARLAGVERASFLYAMSEGHNPLGSSLAEDRKRGLVEIARRHELPIVEDDVYGLLGLDGDSPPPMRALDERWVLYLGSFSKILAPSMRVGWLVVPEDLIEPLTALKHSSDVDTSTFGQQVIARYLEQGRLPAHLDRLRAEYGRRRDAMLEALEKHFSGKARWTRPRAGIFVWLELPEGTDTTRLLEAALDEGVAFCPGEAFASMDPAPLRRSMRLSYAGSSPERIAEGVERLARVVAGNVKVAV
jgi:2-aminoadipate transaminase